MLVLAGFSVFQVTLADRVVEPFSELGVLGPNMKLGDYPREVGVGEDFGLYLYLGNHEGRSMYYRVLVKLGDQAVNVSDSEPMEAPAVAFYEAFLPDGGNETLPIVLSLAETGVNSRLVFELHGYDTEMDGFEYMGQWCQLWLNVTAPPG